MFDIDKEVRSAEKRIRPFIRKTPLEYSFYLSKATGCRVFLKLENLQHTGSFKARGAFSKITSLDRQERKSGVIAASTGNHALAVAYGLRRLGIEGCIFLPENASPRKIKMLRNYNVDLQFYGRDCGDTESYARDNANKQGRVYISPYNDRRVIGGQGTIAVELMQQISDVDCVMASVGGGGLISGIAGYLKEKKGGIEIIGCLPQNSPAMYDSVNTGYRVSSQILPTLSDGTAGGIEEGAITLDPCRHYVDDWVLVDEVEIQESMRIIFEQHRYVIEGAAGVVVAAFLKIREKLKGKKVALIICGGNIDTGKFDGLVKSSTSAL